MVWVDWLILGIVFLSVVISAVRGFIKEALSLLIWLAAVIIAGLFYKNLALLLENLIHTPSLRAAAAWLLIFTAILVIGAIGNYLLSRLVEATGLSGTDRLIGSLFGCARGIIIIMVILIFLPEILPVEQDNWWQNSLLIPHFLRFEGWATDTGTAIIEFVKKWI